MINSPLGYLFALACVVVFFVVLEKRSQWNFLKYIPAVVLIYASSMILASFGVFSYTDEMNALYKLAKSNLLPAMLFLMLLQVDFQHFLQLGRSLLLAYLLALFSLAIGFFVVAYAYGFDNQMASAFGALCGSWMGGTANMIAVGSALGVSQEAFGYALVVDSVNYTLWVMLLLFIVPFAKIFNTFTHTKSNSLMINEIACACTIGAKRYWLLVSLSVLVSLLAQNLANYVEVLNKTTTIVLLASFFGVIGSFTKLRNMNGSSELSTTMLYALVALIGSKAVLENFSNVVDYVVAGFLILVIHAVLMVIGAKIFKLDLFAISVASLSNIGGVASAPILAAAHNKSLVSVGVLMAIMGYLIGTFGGLFVGNVLIWIAS